MAEGVRSAIARSEKVIDGPLTLARSGIVDLTAEADLADVVSQALTDDRQEAIDASARHDCAEDGRLRGPKRGATPSSSNG